ncbi:MAG TPA: hypothetical protein ENJ99_03900, partial [Rhizobiales bacterium]|nr:hypothetical protein [Hyphomicrobiales bacterium]
MQNNRESIPVSEKSRSEAETMSRVAAARASAASIDLADVTRGIWQRKHLIIAVTALAALGSMAFVMTAKPVYRTEARVLVENQETTYNRTTPNNAGQVQVRQQDVKSQVQVAESRDLARRVIKKLGLTRLPEYNPLKKGIGLASRILIRLGFKTDPARETPEQRALTVYYKKVNAYQIPESNVIAISAKSYNPQIAAKIANTLAEEYVDSTREARSRNTGQARDWLAGQIATLRKKVLESETAVEEFRARAGLLKGRDKNATLSSQELSELNSQIILAAAARSEAQAKARAIRNILAKTGSVANSAAVINSPLI